ncbi:MAG TPA: FliH/SctL family protein [Anaerolineaceae bacterium]|nr:FliH/SctL family protein [Anaerolineaceae bacterium]
MDTRSSLKVIAGETGRVCGWQPEELGVGAAKGREKEVRALIDVFRPEQPPAADGCSGAPSSGPQAWTPAEFGQLAPQPSAGQKAVAYFPPTAGRYDRAAMRLSAQDESGRILGEAREEAERLLAEARQQAGQIAAEARQAAAAEQARARAEGLTSGRGEAEIQLAALRQVIDQTNAWREELIAASEQIVLQLVRGTAVALFGHGVELSDAALQQNLNRIVEQAKSLGDLKIYLNPADAAVLDPDWREFQTSITGNRVQIISSETITRGGAFVQGQMGTVDGRVETQLKAVLAALSGQSEAEGSLA